MSLATWWKERRITSIEAKLKRLHAQQRHVRDALHELEARKKKGHGLTEADYEAEKAKLEARKHDLTEKVNALQAEERSVKQELAAARASS